MTDVEKSNKFIPKDLVEVWHDDEEKALRGGKPYIALLLREANAEEYLEYDLRAGKRADWIFYRVLLEEEFHFFAEQYLTLVQRKGVVSPQYVKFAAQPAANETEVAKQTG